MSFNTMQTNFIGRIRTYFANLMDLQEEAYNIRQLFTEVFDTGKDNDLSTAEMETLLAEWGLSFDAIEKACNRFIGGFLSFWENEAVTTREYGRYARRIASNQ